MFSKKPRKPLKRNKPLRGNPEKIKEWKDRSRTRIAPVSKKRSRENRDYSGDRGAFLSEHSICPITGERATEIHHSAKRVAGWLNLKRYWIALSHKAHAWVEENKARAEMLGLMVRINPNETCEQHIEWLKKEGVDIDEPVFYKYLHIKKPELESIGREINRFK